MKVLLGHDYYRSTAPSGEDAVFRNERALLEANGVEVIPFERFNDDIDDSTLASRTRLALNTAWSRQTYADVAAMVRQTAPTVAHFHNTFPLISPSAYAACRNHGVPVVQTLHNYRLLCAGGSLMRDGRPCEDCVGTSLLPALRHRCYRGSFPATAAVVWMLARNRAHGTYNDVDRYIALTAFAAGKLIAGGLPRERIEIKPNFLPDPPDVGHGGGNYAVFVGRLSEEKGVRTLLQAWRQIRGFALKVLGDGPLRNQLEEQARRESLEVEFRGHCPREEILRLVRDAELQIVPSECYEGFPMVVLEAYACGTPIVASRIGSLDEIVTERTGVKFQPGDPDALAATVDKLRSDPPRLQAMRAHVRAAYEEKYTAEQNFLALRAIYAHAIRDFDRGAPASK
jgi:glycosyltransferase involved in cell wall biosynthesis